MEDTTQKARQLVRDVVMSKTAAERFLMCAEMYEEAKEFAKIGMPSNFTAEEQQIYIFHRIHGVTPIESVRQV